MKHQGLEQRHQGNNQSGQGNVQARMQRAAQRWGQMMWYPHLQIQLESIPCLIVLVLWSVYRYLTQAAKWACYLQSRRERATPV